MKCNQFYSVYSTKLTTTADFLSTRKYKSVLKYSDSLLKGWQFSTNCSTQPDHRKWQQQKSTTSVQTVSKYDIIVHLKATWALHLPTLPLPVTAKQIHTANSLLSKTAEWRFRMLNIGNHEPRIMQHRPPIPWLYAVRTPHFTPALRVGVIVVSYQ